MLYIGIIPYISSIILNKDISIKNWAFVLCVDAKEIANGNSSDKYEHFYHINKYNVDVNLDAYDHGHYKEAAAGERIANHRSKDQDPRPPSYNMRIFPRISSYDFLENIRT